MAALLSAVHTRGCVVISGVQLYVDPARTAWVPLRPEQNSRAVSGDLRNNTFHDFTNFSVHSLTHSGGVFLIHSTYITPIFYSFKRRHKGVVCGRPDSRRGSQRRAASMRSLFQVSDGGRLRCDSKIFSFCSKLRDKQNGRGNISPQNDVKQTG